MAIPISNVDTLIIEWPFTVHDDHSMFLFDGSNQVEIVEDWLKPF